MFINMKPSSVYKTYLKSPIATNLEANKGFAINKNENIRHEWY